MLYIGIDPGEKWCGFAALDVTSEGIVRVEARTYSVSERGGYLQTAHDLIDLLPHARKTHVIVEDFRIRKAGHQRFSSGDTLRFIGALEFGAKSVDAFEFFLIPPSDHGAQETRELFGPILQTYRRKTWPRPSHPAWNHCLSAWRVLGHHLFKTDPDILLRLRQTKKSHRIDQWLPVLLRSKDHEHIAPAACWIK